MWSRRVLGEAISRALQRVHSSEGPTLNLIIVCLVVEWKWFPLGVDEWKWFPLGVDEWKWFPLGVDEWKWFPLAPVTVFVAHIAYP